MTKNRDYDDFDRNAREWAEERLREAPGVAASRADAVARRLRSDYTFTPQRTLYVYEVALAEVKLALLDLGLTVKQIMSIDLSGIVHRALSQYRYPTTTDHSAVQGGGGSYIVDASPSYSPYDDISQQTTQKQKSVRETIQERLRANRELWEKPYDDNGHP